MYHGAFLGLKQDVGRALFLSSNADGTLASAALILYLNYNVGGTLASAVLNPYLNFNVDAALALAIPFWDLKF